MNVIKRPLWAVVLLSMVGSVYALDAKSEIKAYYPQFAAVGKKNDYPSTEKLMKGIFAEGFTYTGLNHEKMDGDQLLAQMKKQMTVVKISKVDISVLSITVKANTATVEMSEVLDAQFAGPDKKPHKVHNYTTATDFWVKVGGKWKLKSIKDTMDKTSIDGKAISAGK